MGPRVFFCGQKWIWTYLEIYFVRFVHKLCATQRWCPVYTSSSHKLCATFVYTLVHLLSILYLSGVYVWSWGWQKKEWMKTSGLFADTLIRYWVWKPYHFANALPIFFFTLLFGCPKYWKKRLLNNWFLKSNTPARDTRADWQTDIRSWSHKVTSLVWGYQWSEKSLSFLASVLSWVEHVIMG